MSTPEKSKPLGLMTLRNVRLAYVHLDAPWSKDGPQAANAKYCLSIIIGKDDKQLAELKDSMRAVATAKWGDAYTNKKMKPIFCLRDGSDRDHKEGFDETVMFFNASRRPEEGRPKVKNLKGRDLNPKEDADEWPYSGCMGHVVVKFWAQDNPNGQRINAEIHAVVKYKDGDRFGGDNAVNVDEALSGLVEAEDLSSLTADDDEL